jgi:hypothetical protein
LEELLGPIFGKKFSEFEIYKKEKYLELLATSDDLIDLLYLSVLSEDVAFINLPYDVDFDDVKKVAKKHYAFEYADNSILIYDDSLLGKKGKKGFVLTKNLEVITSKDQYPFSLNNLTKDFISINKLKGLEYFKSKILDSDEIVYALYKFYLIIHEDNNRNRYKYIEKMKDIIDQYCNVENEYEFKKEIALSVESLLRCKVDESYEYLSRFINRENYKEVVENLFKEVIKKTKDLSHHTIVVQNNIPPKLLDRGSNSFLKPFLDNKDKILLYCSDDGKNGVAFGYDYVSWRTDMSQKHKKYYTWEKFHKLKTSDSTIMVVKDSKKKIYYEFPSLYSNGERNQVITDLMILMHDIANII